MANIFQKLFNRKQTSDGIFPFQFLWTGAGFTMVPATTNTYIEDGYMGNSAVFSVVNLIIQKFAQVPFYVYKVKGQKQLQQYKAVSQRGYSEQAIIRKAGAMDEVSENDPVARLLAKPNRYQTDAEFRMMALLFLKVTGGVPIYANMGITGMKLQSLNVLPPQWVTLVPDPSLMDIGKVYFSPLGAMNNELPRQQVYMWKYTNPKFDTNGTHLYGLSPLKAGLLDMQAGTEAAKAMSKMYQNGGARGVFTPKQPLSQQQISDFREALDSWINGSDMRNKAGALSAPVDFYPVGLDAVDMALLSGKQITDERICSIYNVDPAILKGEKKYDNSNQAVKYIVTNTIYSDLVAYREIWNKWVLPLMGYSEGQYFVDFDISVLPEMQEDMEKIVQQADKMWWITPNEKRALSKYDTMPDPAMDSVFLPSGFTHISEAFIPDNVTVTDDYQPATP